MTDAPFTEKQLAYICRQLRADFEFWGLPFAEYEVVEHEQAPASGYVRFLRKNTGAEVEVSMIVNDSHGQLLQYSIDLGRTRPRTPSKPRKPPVPHGRVVVPMKGGGLMLLSFTEPVAAFVNGVTYTTAKHWSDETDEHIRAFVVEHDRSPVVMEQIFFDGLMPT